MILLIFDIDGTLTDTKKVDDWAFLAAFQDKFKVVLSNIDWDNYTHVTDSGLFKELYEALFQKEPAAEEKVRFQSRFFKYLETALNRNQEDFREIKGAGEFISFCCSQKDFKVTLATGGWKYSAILKLEAADIPYAGLPLSTSDNHISRAEILRQAIEDSKIQYQIEHFDSIIYFGDGKWDLLATKQLNIPFIGVDALNDQKLHKMGVTHVIQNFGNKETIIGLVRQIINT